MSNSRPPEGDGELTNLGFATALWILIFLFMVTFGIVDQSGGRPADPVKRVELLFPGYRIGRWLARPLR